MYIRDDPLLYREAVVLVSSSKYFETTSGCLQESQVFPHNDAVTCLQIDTYIYIVNLHCMNQFYKKQTKNCKDY